MEKTYKVYKIQPRLGCYGGSALAAADSAEEVNQLIDSFVAWDKDNACDSWGYSHVDESDMVESLFAFERGILDHGIYYTG